MDLLTPVKMRLQVAVRNLSPLQDRDRKPGDQEMSSSLKKPIFIQNDASSKIRDMMTLENTPIRNNVKKAFARDVAAFKDALSTSKEILSSIASPKRNKRKMTNLINEDRKSFVAVDLGVNLCLNFDDETEEKENIKPDNVQGVNPPKKIRTNANEN